MAATQHGGLNNESCLRELTHSSFNEPLKAQNAVTFKLVKTVSDFTQHLSQIYEQNAEQLQLLVENFRKRNGELRKERPACPSSLFHTWETLLQEVEIDSQNHSDIASILSRQVSRPLLERSFHRKIQSRKVFTHRESFETIISKTEEKLSKCRQEYKTAYLSYLSEPSQKSLSGYFNTHNAYVQQLHATNGMLDEYSKTTLPNLLQELEEIYTDLCSSVADSILQGAETISQRATDQTRRYDSLSSQCRGVSGPTDLIQFARALPTPAHNKPILRRLFNPPQPPHNDNSTPGDGANTATSGTSDGAGQFDHFNEINIPPPLKNELVIDRLASVQIKPSLDALRKEQQDLETQIKQIQDSLDALIRVKQRSLESQLFNKVNELEEDISAKRFDLHVAQIHLRAIQFQKELFTSKADAGDSSRERKMSSTSQGSMKSKWLKAFKSLKTPPSSANTSPRESEKEKKNQMYHAVSTIISMRRNGGGMRNMGESEAHTFQEYTYKKITPCDVCSQVLRGHTRQGLKCRVCKMNVHVDCQEKATRCQSKSRLLRRQKSTSEIDTRFNEAAVEEETSEFDGEDNYFTYPKVNRQLSFKDTHSRVTYIPTELDTKPISGSTSTSDGSMRRRLFAGMKSLTGFGSRSRHGSPNSRSISLPETPHSPRRQKLNLRMKSLSLDSPESTEHVQRRRHGGGTSAGVASATSGTTIDQSNSSSSRIQSPSSPVHNRRLLSARNMRMSSVELPDDNEKSLSSASTSPCPSPKAHRLLPTNLYVILYNYKSRQADELDLKAGYKVTVIDTSDNDWWKGKCLGKVGYFPSKYCTRLQAGEKPLQVTQNLRIAGGDNNEGLLLLRDQIVIQIAEELDGMIMVRNGNNQTGCCPTMFLQEV
ncbi:uncharacterized protein LOC123298621 [Chrysoperla carnea]|uniref:uncharacterized protein LOC123298621 n=1 Tax=Chrysoperla carnea TaxID=189513 RepID=UPI001D05CA95|nr:uncharacterized protein LOC123298621 [Chrysoperla carnea]